MNRTTGTAPRDPLGPARRMAAFIGDIIGAASVAPPGRWHDSPIHCRRRPGHRRCAGRMRVRARDDDYVEYLCPICDDRGTIHNWRGGPSDFSDLRPASDRSGIEITLADAEFDEMKRSGLLEDGSLRLIYGATYVDAVVLRGSAEDFEELTCDLEFEIDDEPGRQRRLLLDQVLARIEALLRAPRLN